MSKGYVFDKLIFTELRIIPVTINDRPLEDCNLIKAMTVNEEMKNLGYTLKPEDVINLSRSNQLDGFINIFRNLIGDVTAKPMYPDFPVQVMKMDEATYRFHQLLHYWSTYGVTEFTGESVSKGWLPEVEDTDKLVDDTTLLKAKVVELFVQSETQSIYDYVYRKILSKRERMSLADEFIITECVSHLSDTTLIIKVPFKQNLLQIFNYIFTNQNRTSDDKIKLLQGICQHTGDIWKCMDYALTQANYHLCTSQKRLLVKLLESYPINDFKSNIILSNKKGKRTNLMLQYLDYNTYSRKSEYKKIVSDFRNGDLHSWESHVKRLISQKDPTALKVVCEHPGTALRMLAYLLRQGYAVIDIYKELVEHVSELSTQTLIENCKYFYRSADQIPENKSDEFTNVYSICYTLLSAKLQSLDTPVKNKKVYLSTDDYNIEKSIIMTNSKSDEGGYIRSGIAYAIPKNVDKLRFFVYWDDKRRVDVDLHASCKKVNGDNFHIGYYADYISDNGSIVTSGDITHSNAAEYIDVNLLDSDISSVTLNIDVYAIEDNQDYVNNPKFKDIEECYVGCMAVDSIGQEVKLYNPKNCFFTHYLKGDYKSINYGYIDVVNRCIVFDGSETHRTDSTSKFMNNTNFTLAKYIYLLAISQNVSWVSSKEDADVVLILDKPSTDKEISLIDNNFFMDIQ